MDWGYRDLLLGSPLDRRGIGNVHEARRRAAKARAIAARRHRQYALASLSADASVDALKLRRRREEGCVSGPASIAVVEDDDGFRPALVGLLSSLGYSACGFPSAEELIASHLESSYDCIITDIHLAGMSGIDLKCQLSDRGLRVPVIMITARSDPGLEGRAAASGAVCLLRKPFESSALVEHLERALGAASGPAGGAPSGISDRD